MLTHFTYSFLCSEKRPFLKFIIIIFIDFIDVFLYNIIIDKVEKVESLINKIPENITKKDEAAIKSADDAYKALSNYEKSLVDKDAKKALDAAKADLKKLNRSANSKSPVTSDSSNLWLWAALLFVSGASIFGITLYDRKKSGK